MKGTRGTETSNYPEEKKVKTIPKVVASEIGRGQTKYSNIFGVRVSNKVKKKPNRICLEKQTKESKSLVGERVQKAKSTQSTSGHEES